MSLTCAKGVIWVITVSEELDVAEESDREEDATGFFVSRALGEVKKEAPE
jgi:hypothetical protein